MKDIVAYQCKWYRCGVQFSNISNGCACICYAIWEFHFKRMQNLQPHQTVNNHIEMKEMVFHHFSVRTESKWSSRTKCAPSVLCAQYSNTNIRIHDGNLWPFANFDLNQINRGYIQYCDNAHCTMHIKVAFGRLLWTYNSIITHGHSFRSFSICIEMHTFGDK